MQPDTQYARAGQKRTDAPTVEQSPPDARGDRARVESVVELRTRRGAETVTVSHSVLAVADSVIDMARREAGVTTQEFVRGRVVA